MTRETKVGLLVGICVILLIGIIISDQLTVMQQPAPAQFTDAAAGAQDSLTPLPLNDPAASMPLTPPPRVRESVLPLPEDLTPTVPQVQTVEQPRVAPLPSDRTTFVEVATNQQVAPDAMGQFHPVNSSPPTVTLSATDRPASATPAAADTLRRQPAPLYHDVATGETLYQIAQRYYGNGEQWRVIREANMDKVDARGNVKLGVRLTIPNKAGLIQAAPLVASNRVATPTQTSNALGAQAPQATATGNTALRLVQQQSAVRTVTVEKGQTLGALARTHLGSSSKWPELLAANRDQLRNPQDLKAGMTLKLPGSSASAPSMNTGASVPPQATAATLAAGNTPGSAPAAAPSGRTYTVVAGDSLYSIATKTLGDGTQYEKIFNANRDQLKDPDDIALGMVLKVPG